MAEFYLETERLIIRNWRDEDRELFHLINSDDQVMEFFPFRRDRAASDKMMDDLRAGIAEDGFGFTALELKDTGEVAGFCGLAKVSDQKNFEEFEIEIGWRLAPRFWARGFATESAKRLLEFGFREFDFPEIVSFAVENNFKSVAVMERIGMTRDPLRDFDHEHVPDTHPHLKRHVTYAIENPKKRGH
ncbi:MAG: GNAT family N-acetyltransferase [Pseudomonadota bacterium]